MIIFGISTKQKLKPAGQHSCPACNQHASFGRIVTARRFSLFFIPIIPLGSSDTGRVVCQNCGSEFAASMIQPA